MKNNNWQIKVIGWAGTFFILVAYTVNSLGYITSENIIYPILNLVGAALLGIRVFADKNWSNVFLEVFWLGIAIVAILKIIQVI